MTYKERDLANVPRETAKAKIKAMHRTVPHFFRPEIGSRIRREKLHQLVFKTLGLKRTTANIFLLKSVLKAQKIEEIMICKYRFYAGPPVGTNRRKSAPVFFPKVR